MIGISLSGVTFISVPGWVATSQFSYMQMVLGYLLGYAVIAFILLPLYYRMGLTSIYTYLETRMGPRAYQTGAGFFYYPALSGPHFVSISWPSSFNSSLKKPDGPPFCAAGRTVDCSHLSLHLPGGIRTVVFTDTLQTFFMLASVGLTVAWIARDMSSQGAGMIEAIQQSSYSQIFFWESGPKNFFCNV